MAGDGGRERTGRALSGWVVVAAGAWALLIGLVADRASLAARLGPIDDHEVAQWAGPDGRVSWADVGRRLPGALGLRKFTGELRYRPAYGALRLLEARWFGAHPGRWYLERSVLQALVVTALAVVATAVIVRAGRSGPDGWTEQGAPAVGSGGPARGGAGRLGRLVPFVVALVLVTGLTGLESWNDIVTRLGPSELHAAVGVAVLAVGAYGLVVDGRARWWTAAAIGLALAIWSKENMAVLLVPTAPVLVIGARRHHRRGWAVAVGAAGVAAATVVAVAVGPALLRRGTDVYGTGLGGGRLSGMLHAWSARPVLLAFPVVYLVVVSAWAAWYRRRTAAAPTGPAGSAAADPDPLRRSGPWVAVALAFPVVQLLDQFFSGGAPPDLRYRLLTDLAAAAEVVVVVALVVWSAATVPTPTGSSVATPAATPAGPPARRVAVTTLVATLVLTAPFLLLAAVVLHQRTAIAATNRTQTVAYQALLTDLADGLRRDPDSALVMAIDEPWKREVPVALAADLRVRGVRARQMAAVLATGDRPAGGRRVVDLTEPGTSEPSWVPQRRLDPAATRTCLFLFDTPRTTPVPACAGARARSWFTGGWWQPVEWSQVTWRWLVPGR